jgi:chromosome segregation protein
LRLKSIKLAGFKSFVDPTTVPFQSNMTAIVGPNGCGKSNVIDAVRWVMGESSAKHLRGESMTDVIFNGSVSRKPVSRASIELVFDNTEGRAAGEYAKFAEIAVKREVTREGQSKYFLNGTSCRRRDVTDLFLGTGLGPRSYAIIEQGMIARIIEAKPEELRTYVEEAAGVSKYKERRRETESRISRTRENLDRLNDLSDELGRQLDRLKRQADAAERYKILKAESRDLESLIFWYQLQEHKDKQQAEIEAKDACQKQLDQLASALSTNERARIDTQVVREDANQALDTANTAYYTHAATLSRLEASKQAYEQQVRQLSANQERIAKEITYLKGLIDRDREEGVAADQKKSQIEPQLEKIETDLGRLDSSIAEFEEKLTAQESERGQLASELGRVKSEITRLETEKQGLERQQRQDTKRLEAIEQGLAQLSDTDPQLITELNNALIELNEWMSAQQAELSELRIAQDEADAAVTQQEEQLREQQGTLQSAEAELEKASRIIVAESRIDDQETSAWVEKHAQITGRVLEHIELPEDDRAAFEAAYPELLSAFVADDLSTLDIDALPAGLRVVSSAYVQKLPAQLSKAQAPHATDGEGYTETGLRFGPGWIERVTGRSTGILDLKARVPDLERAKQAASDAVGVMQRQLDQLREAGHLAATAVKEKTAAVQELEKESVQLSNRVAGLEAKNQEVETSRDRLSHEKESLIRAQATIDHEAKQLAQQLNEMTQLRGSLQEKLTPLHQSLDGDKGSLSRLRGERHKLVNVRSDLRVEVERLSGIKSRSETQIERLQGQLSSLESELATLASNSQSLANQPAVTEEDLKQAVSESQQLEEQLTKSRQTLSEKDELLRLLESERSGIERDREAQSQALGEIRLKAQAIEIEVNRLQSELRSRDATEAHLVEFELRFGNRDVAETELARIETRVERLGPINLVALDEYQKELERKAELDHQHAELTEALGTLEDAIRKIDRETRSLFRNTFDAINQSFGEIFPQLFGGGEAWLMLTDEDLLSTGVTIMARPPGKRNSSIYLLSGGEKALTALSLVFAIFQLNPAPFCLLDEVDAPLDDANVGRYADAVAKMSQSVQFIYITHNKIAMERAEQLMGVTMSEPGVSRLVSVDIERAVELATTE